MPNIDFNLKTHDNAFENDDVFDSSFSFMNIDTSMDYYLASPPEGAKSPGTSGNQPHEGAKEPSDDRFSLSPLTMNDQAMQPLDISNTVYSYPPYALTYQHQQAIGITGANIGSHHPVIYQPYRPGTSGDFTKRPLRSPESPSLSSSPHGSIESSRLSFSAPNAASPSLVSPGSLSGSIPDPSPTHSYAGYHAPFYSSAPSVGMPGTGMSRGNISPTGPGLSMVAGFPYPTSMVSQQQGSETGPMRSQRSRTRGKKVKEEDVDDDDDDHSSKGLGLTNEHEDRVPVSNKREDVRRARIESEQRRRDELREGFKRLKDALPITNQRSSKSSLLDRSVAHIQAIEGANRYLLAQLEEQQKECAKLREILHGEVMQRNVSDSPDQPGQRHH